ncbi:hypothetical protein C2G38_2196824 [Gigaspora rosea]|uniref:Uncharacterized protein n=1 Tax=Gigaspora rosea TaxID=44941 RepID=A0A397UU82_9GLOM|nr:hypothetical protein C2G38_2196824 [Gigaspora rosea]
MTSVFAAVSFIKNVSDASILTGIATYRLGYDELVHYNYKAFSSAENQHMINSRFVLENSQLNITPCKSWDFNKNSTSFFTLERRAYNPLTSHYITSEIACSFNAGNSRHIGVPKAIETKANMSV